MKFNIEVSKDNSDALWGAYLAIDDTGFDGTGQTPESAILSLLSFPEVQAELNQN